MENLNRLKKLYTEDQRVARMLKSLDSSAVSKIHLQNAIGSQYAFLINALYEQSEANHVIVASDKEQAAYIQNTLENLMGDKEIHLYVDSFRTPTKFEELDRNNILIRTETINKINIGSGKKEIIVTYPEALFEKVADPKLIQKEKIEITKGAKLDLDFIIEVLVEYGFTRSEFVYEPGQFSIRGGIIDIFSYGNEWPYRVELFDDEVESIRTFNPSDQLSLKNIAKVSIIPDINKKYSVDQKVSLLRLFEENTTIWIDDLSDILDRIQICFEKADAFAKTVQHLEDEDLHKLFKDRAFIYPNEIYEDILEHLIIFKNDTLSKFAESEQISFESKPQPSFNRNFKLLIKDIQEHSKGGIETYLFTENNRQIQRFETIFNDLNAKVHFHPIVQGIHEGFIDPVLKVACYTDHQIFERFHRYRLKKGFSKDKAISMKLLRELQSGDFVVHIDHGVGKYSGLEKLEINGQVQESVRLLYKNNDILYVGINSLHKISKFVGKDGKAPKLDKIGSDTWKKIKSKTKRKIKDIAKELIALYAKRRATPGFAHAPDGHMQNELEASFIYEDTPDQEKATIAIKDDMMKDNPMDRLICGDVGFGKTEVALRGAFKAAVSGKQVAILVPTTILALQHYKTLSDRFKDFPITVDYINRFRSSAEKTEIYKKLADGAIDILIGTHAILNKKVQFKDLGLLIIDEEQKFGVAAKEKLRAMKVNVDTLTLTATPIPRTLQFSLMAARDLSIIRTPPPNRQPIHTERRVFNDQLIKEAIYYETNRGGQVFFVHNRVKSLPEITGMIQRLCPDVEVGMAHGQMEAKELEKRLIDFIDYKYDVLVSTNIIETGLDIPNANTMIINNSHQFGLSDLHQLRGRVGRSNKKAYCYLFAPPLTVLTGEARKRLKILEEFSDLGSGFDIAMKDLDIRGAGNLLGGEQSGFIADIGFETYQKILDESIQELKETDFKDVFKEEIDKKKIYVQDVDIDTDIEMLIPDEYVSNIQERLNLYTELDSIKNEEDLEKFANGLKDRFGDIPKQVKELFSGLRIRWVCRELGFERVILKKNKLRCYFISNPQSLFFESDQFNAIMQYISSTGVEKGISLKQSNSYLIMIKEGVRKLGTTLQILTELRDDIQKTQDTKVSEGTVLNA